MTKCSSCGCDFGKYNHLFQSGICPDCKRNSNFLAGLDELTDTLRNILFNFTENLRAVIQK